jgi:hypothetical protein
MVENVETEFKTSTNNDLKKSPNNALKKLPTHDLKTTTKVTSVPTKKIDGKSKSVSCEFCSRTFDSQYEFHDHSNKVHLEGEEDAFVRFYFMFQYSDVNCISLSTISVFKQS